MRKFILLISLLLVVIITTAQNYGAALYLITNQAIYDNNKAMLDEYIAYKQECCSEFYVKMFIKEVDYPNTAIGMPTIEAIRSLLRNELAYWDSVSPDIKIPKYLILIGNPHYNTNVVPMARLDRNATTLASSDYMYANVSGNWDIGKPGYQIPDGKYGTPFFHNVNTGYIDYRDYYPGGASMEPEFYVGRWPVFDNGVSPDLRKIIWKSMEYSKGRYAGPWVKTVQASLYEEYTYNVYRDYYKMGEDLKDSILEPNGFNIRRIYRNFPGPQSLGLEDPESCLLSRKTAMEGWAKRAGIHWWFSHGSSTRANVICWSPISNDDPTYFIDDPATLIERNEADAYVEYPSFVITHSCSGLYPYNANSLAYRLMQKGAIAVVGHVGTAMLDGVYKPEKPYWRTLNAGYQTIKKLVEGYTFGEAFWEGKNDYWKSQFLDDGRYIHYSEGYQYNMFGDPTLRLMVEDDVPMPPIVSYQSDIKLEIGTDSTELTFYANSKYHPTYEGSDIDYIKLGSPIAIGFNQWIFPTVVNDSTLKVWIKPHKNPRPMRGIQELKVEAGNEAGLVSKRVFKIHLTNNQ